VGSFRGGAAFNISKITIYYALILVLSSVFMRDVFNYFVSMIGRNYLAAVVWVIFVVSTAALFLAFRTLDRQRIWWFLALMCMGLLYAASFQIFEERVHLLKYGLLAWLVCKDLSRAILRPTLLVPIGVVAAVITAMADELLQSITPGRVGDPRDVLFDAIGGLWGSLLFLLLKGIPARRSDFTD